MSRSNYSYDGGPELNLWRANVDRAPAGKRGQAFLRELAQRMDEMPEKKLIAGDLVTPAGECCTIGVVCKGRGLDTKDIDIEDPEAVGRLVGLSRVMAAEIEYINDERGPYGESETPEARWVRMREWVSQNLRPAEES